MSIQEEIKDCCDRIEQIENRLDEDMLYNSMSKDEVESLLIELNNLRIGVSILEEEFECMPPCEMNDYECEHMACPLFDECH